MPIDNDYMMYTITNQTRKIIFANIMLDSKRKEIDMGNDYNE